MEKEKVQEILGWIIPPVIIVIIFAVMIFVASRDDVKEVEKIEVTAVVTEENYEASKIMSISVYDSVTRTVKIKQQPVPAKYKVTITYEDVSETFNDKELYDKVKEGEAIQMLLCTIYKKDGKVEKTLEFPE